MDRFFLTTTHASIIVITTFNLPWTDQKNVSMHLSMAQRHTDNNSKITMDRLFSMEYDLGI